MKKHSILSFILALALFCSMLTIGAAAAPLAGDVDGNGVVAAADARKALRASVKLETLTPQQILVADVDPNPGVTAADARLILRASVKIETLQLKQKFFDGHPVNNDSIGIETGIVCSDPSCCGKTLVPSFNELVNSLKAQGSSNYQCSFSMSEEVTSEPVITGPNSIALKLLMKDSFEAGTVKENSEVIKNRHVNSTNFYVFGESYVSALKESDVKSITMTRMNGVDFVKNLPDSYKATKSGKVTDLKGIKNADIGDVYKVSVVLYPETVTPTSLPTEVTPIEKIMRSDYNDGFKQQFAELEDVMAETPEMKNFMSMDMKVVTACTVDYYFTVDTLEPVCARYQINMDMDTITNIKAGIIPDKITIKAKTSQDSYYFFNGHFTVA